MLTLMSRGAEQRQARKVHRLRMPFCAKIESAQSAIARIDLMTSPMNSTSALGCNKCGSSEAAEAWKVVTGALIETCLIDEPHYIVSIRTCASCAQRYFQVTTETVDYADGEDPIYRTIVPINDAERAGLMSSKPLDTRAIEAVGIGRRSLKYDWPKGKDPSTYWGTGIHVGEHD